MDQQVALLQKFVELCKTNPNILHESRFLFYREYLESMGAKIPSLSSEDNRSTADDNEGTDGTEMDVPDLDMSFVIEGDTDDPLPMGDSTKEITEEDGEKAEEERNIALTAFINADYSKAVEHFTKAIELNPGLALLHAKRAHALLKLKKPNAAIRDCDKAISINPDSAQAYKFRGRANHLLGKFVEGFHDLATACKLDYDDVANEWLKELEPNAKKVLEYQRTKERENEEAKIQRRRQLYENAQQQKRGTPKHDKPPTFSMPNFEGGLEGLGEIFGDPEIQECLKDQSVLTAYFDILQNPANMCKHMGNEKVRKLMEKMEKMEKFAATNKAKPQEDSPNTTTADMPKPPNEPELD